MRKFVKFVLLIFGLFFVAAVAFPFVSHWLDQPHQREIQAKVLNGNCSKVQLQNGKVLLVLSERRHLLRSMDSRDPFIRSLLLSVGSQFKASDHHWGATYTVKSIDADGVNIYFEADGSSPAAVRSSSGTVKLAWK